MTERRESSASGPPTTTTTISYKPDPPDVSVTLRSPPGSPGTTLSAYEIFYEYTTPAQQREGKPPVVVGPILVPMPATVVPAAGELAYGEPVLVVVPIGSRTLNDVFRGGRDSQPALVMAKIEFKDANGVPVQDRNLNTLKVSVPIRSM